MYFGSLDKYFYAVDIKTGKEKWKWNTQSEIWASASIAQKIVYFGCTDGYFYALDIKTGKQIWKFKTGFVKWSSPAIANGIVYFTSDGYLYALY